MIGNWQHQMEIRYRDGTLDDSLIWSIADGQSADMFVGALHNFQVIAGLREPENLQLASDSNNYASNRINMWWYVLPRSGVPLAAVFITAGTCF